MTAALGRGRILIWEGASLWLMQALAGANDAVNATAFHSHHAVQVTLSLGGRFTLRTRDREIAMDSAVAPDISHMFEAVGGLAVLFIEPESRAGRAVTGRLFGGDNTLVSIPPDLAGDLVAQLTPAFNDGGNEDAALIALGRMLVARLAGEADADMPDPRVQKMMAFVAARLDGPVALSAAARAAGLSPGRARHLFVEQIGLPFRTYVLWQRITKGVGLYAGGASLTEAAHESGFADSAHFSRTFRRMFGLPAAALRLT